MEKPDNDIGKCLGTELRSYLQHLPARDNLETEVQSKFGAGGGSVGNAEISSRLLNIKAP